MAGSGSSVVDSTLQLHACSANKITYCDRSCACNCAEACDVAACVVYCCAATAAIDCKAATGDAAAGSLNADRARCSGIHCAAESNSAGACQLNAGFAARLRNS